MDGVSLPTSLEHARVTSLPSTSYYIPNFISEEEERIILDKVRLVTPFFPPRFSLNTGQVPY